MNDEEKFQCFIDSVKFDDEPRTEHRNCLEEQLLAEYDAADPVPYEPEPMAIYLRKLAVAAGFLLVCGLTFWVVDTAWLQNPDLTYHPDPQIVRRILEAENPTEAEKHHLMAQINEVWRMICEHDTQGLVTTIQSPDIAGTVRQWAAEELGEMGDKKTLEELKSIEEKDPAIDPDSPLNTAVEELQQRLETE